MKTPTFAMIHGALRKDITRSTSTCLSSGTAKAVLQLNSFTHHYLFLCFVATCGEKEEHFSFLQPFYYLIPKKKQFSSNGLVVFLAWYPAPCSDWCRKISFIRNHVASIWREELTALGQWLLSVLPHTVWNFCVLSILCSGKFCST